MNKLKKDAKKANQSIRNALRQHGVTVWMLADAYGASEGTMYRLFRHELDQDEQSRIISMIEAIAREHNNAD